MKERSFSGIIRNGLAGLFHIFAKELKATVRDEGVLIFFLLVPLAYPLVYAFIYTNEVVREVPAAVVDDNNSTLSRKYLRLMDASADVQIQSYCADMEEAKSLMKEKKVYGVIHIPESFSRDISQGRQTQVNIYCDMSGMLYYKAILLSATNASLTVNEQIKIQRMGNTTQRQDEVSTAPIEYEDISLFNPQDGFASFLIPAVLMLILQQTLLLGIGMSAGTARETNRFKDLVPIGRHYEGTLRIVFGKSMAYLLIYIAISAYVLCAVPQMFSLVQIAQPSTLMAFIFPYLLACIFFAMTCSIFIHHREACMLVYVFTSIPLLFISGISWPGAAVPSFWKVFSWLFPSTFGINGFVQINNMGATLQEVLPEYRALWIQAGVYFLTTCLVYRRQVMLSRRHALERLQKLRSGNFSRRFILPVMISMICISIQAAVPGPAQNGKTDYRITVKKSNGDPQLGVFLRIMGRTQEYTGNAQGIISFQEESSNNIFRTANLFFTDDKKTPVLSFRLNEAAQDTIIYLDSPEDRRLFKQSGQLYPIEGYVLDNLGKPITGAVVSIQGTGRKALTDEIGLFRLDADFSHPITIRADGMENLSLSIQPFLQNTSEPYPIRLQPKGSNRIYTSVEEMPEYPGGMKAFQEYLDRKITYPEALKKNKTEGIVIIQFVVEKDGSISTPHVVRPLEATLDTLALKAIQEMPRWTAGKDHGTTVRCRYSLPVSFKVPEEKVVATPSSRRRRPDTADKPQPVRPVFKLGWLKPQPLFIPPRPAVIPEKLPLK